MSPEWTLVAKIGATMALPAFIFAMKPTGPWPETTEQWALLVTGIGGVCLCVLALIWGSKW